MADNHNIETRSFNMSQIKSADTRPELLIRKFIFAKGFRYRLHDKKLPGKPDLVLPKYKTVIFVNGCFWHGHKNCKKFVIPKSRTDYWENKIKNNVLRDIKNTKELKSQGWNVIVIWECQIKKLICNNALPELIEN